MATKSTKTSSDPQTMEELLASATTPVKTFSVGQKVRAVVLAKNPKSIILDIGGKSEGVVVDKAYSEARGFAETLNVGDEVNASVLISEAKDGTVILSLREAMQGQSWKKLEDAKAKDLAVAVFGKGAVASGVTVDVEGLNGFIPTSQLGREVAKNIQSLVGKYFKAKVVEIDRMTNKLVLSEKEVSEEADIKLIKKALSEIKEGDRFSGVVTTVANFGCFVRIEVPADDKKVSMEGLVHISELSWSKVVNTSEVVTEGDKVEVKVIGVRDNKLSLSMKKAGKDPWEEAEKKYKVDSKFKGKVTKISDFGAFVELEPGIEGLVHLTKIPPGTRLEEDQEVNVFIDEFEPNMKKISLGLVLTSKPLGYK